jgi:hypothetical protein
MWPILSAQKVLATVTTMIIFFETGLWYVAQNDLEPVSSSDPPFSSQIAGTMCVCHHT